MKTTNLNPSGLHASDATRGRKSTLGARGGGVHWRDIDDVVVASTATFIGARVTEDDEGGAVVTIGGSVGGGGMGSGGGGDDGSGFYTVDEADDLFLTRRNGEGAVIVTNATSGSAATLDLSAANVFDLTLTANCTLTFTNPPTSGEWTIILRQDGTGSRTVTWPAAVDWQDTDGTGGGSAPTLFTAATAENVITITTLDGGTTYGGGSESVTATGATTLDGLTDVVITSPVTADRLRYNGSSWVNSALIWTPMTVFDPTTGNYLPLVDGSGNQLMAEV